MVKTYIYFKFYVCSLASSRQWKYVDSFLQQSKVLLVAFSNYSRYNIIVQSSFCFRLDSDVRVVHFYVIFRYGSRNFRRVGCIL